MPLASNFWSTKKYQNLEICPCSRLLSIFKLIFPKKTGLVYPVRTQSCLSVNRITIHKNCSMSLFWNFDLLSMLKVLIVLPLIRISNSHLPKSSGLISFTRAIWKWLFLPLKTPCVIYVSVPLPYIQKLIGQNSQKMKTAMMYIDLQIHFPQKLLGGLVFKENSYKLFGKDNSTPWFANFCTLSANFENGKVHKRYLIMVVLLVQSHFSLQLPTNSLHHDVIIYKITTKSKKFSFSVYICCCVKNLSSWTWQKVQILTFFPKIKRMFISSCRIFTNNF